MSKRFKRDTVSNRHISSVLSRLSFDNGLGGKSFLKGFATYRYSHLFCTIPPNPTNNLELRK